MVPKRGGSRGIYTLLKDSQCKYNSYYREKEGDKLYNWTPSKNSAVERLVPTQYAFDTTVRKIPIWKLQVVNALNKHSYDT